MFQGYSKFCIWLEKKGLDINASFLPAVYIVMWAFALFSLQSTHNTGKDHWPFVLYFYLFSLILVWVWMHFFCGHPCLNPKKPKEYRVEVLDAVEKKVTALGISPYQFRTAFNGTNEELEYVADYTRDLIREHIRDVPMFEKVCNTRYTGRVWFFNNRNNALRVWVRHRHNLGSVPGFHSIASNVSYVYVPDHSYVGLVETVLHERIHSFVLDESVTNFATFYLLMKFGTPEEKAYACSRVLHYCQDYMFDSYTQYSYCIWYFNKYLT